MPKRTELDKKKHLLTFSSSIHDTYTITTKRHDALKKNYKRLKKLLAEPTLDTRNFYESAI